MIGVQRTELIDIKRPGLTRIHRPEIISIRVQRTGMIMVGQWFILKPYPEPHGQVTAYNRSPVH